MRKIKILLIIISIALNVVFLIGAVWALDHQIQTRKDRALYQAVISQQTVNNPIVFLGDSLTSRCEWSEMFASGRVLNRGIDADTTQKILDRIDSTIMMHPEKVFIMSGLNDLHAGRTQEEIIADFKKVLVAIKAGSPETKIFIQSILPVNNDLRIVNRVTNEAKIPKINDALKQLSKEQGVTYINLYPAFVHDDKLNSGYSTDGVHLNGQGYRVWKNQIDKYVLK